MPVPADQKVAQHGGVLEQFDVLEGAGDAELGDADTAGSSVMSWSSKKILPEVGL